MILLILYYINRLCFSICENIIRGSNQITLFQFFGIFSHLFMKNTLDTNNLLSAFLIIAFCLVTISCNYSKNDLQSHIDWLNTRLKSRLIREDVPFRFMDTWAAKKGLY